jgi:NAD(P)-dependent dehydrogenase (short-subunit alcohol dehydrogenase family)
VTGQTDRSSSGVAVVTGASRGIGAGIAIELARAGFDVALWARDVEATATLADSLVTEHGVRSLATCCDVRDEASVAAACAVVVGELGAPTLLVNNAAASRRARLEDLPVEEWDDVVRTNLRGPFVCTKHVGRYMLEEGRGCIVNIASVSGSVPQPYFGAYSATKAGLVALTRQTAVEWGGRGVRCNAISPGFVPTATSAAVYADPALRAEREAFVPLGRLGTTSDIGRAVVFLASDNASYINGVNLFVDGGLSLSLIDQIPALGPDGQFINVRGRR